MFGGAIANTDEVTFTVNTQQVATRASYAGQGSAANKLYYGVYQATETDPEGKVTEWELIPALSALTPDYKTDNNITVGKTPADITSNTVKVTIKFAKRKQYSVIFWAQSDAPMCTVDWGARTMSLKENVVSNAEGNDVFWSYEPIKLTSAVSPTVNLYRPFAQLNIGTSTQDFADAVAAETEVTQTKVSVKDMPTTMNLETGKVSDKRNVVYSYAAIPDTIIFPVANHRYLALNYVLVDKEDKALYDITLSYKDDNNMEYTCEEFTGVPVKRNYRTNIYGSLLANSAEFSVKLESDLLTPDENIEIVEVGTAADLQEVIDNLNDPNNESDSLTIVLTDDIDLGDLFGGSNAPAMSRSGNENHYVALAEGKSLTLDLNGKTLSHTKEQSAGYQMILNDGNLTINDSKGGGKISYTDTGNGGEYISDVIYNRSVLVINGGTIENLSSATVASNGYPHAVDTYSGIRNTSVTINGGTIYCAEYSAVRMFCVSATYAADLVINGGTIKGAVDMQNGTKNAALGTLTINDGTFETTKNANNIRFANWNGGATEYGLTAAINGGTFNGGITTAYVPAAANWDKGIITGGTFAMDVTEYCAYGYKCEQNEDGTYTVSERPIVAKIGDAEYFVFAEAVKAVEEGQTITILSKNLEEGTIKLPATLKNVTFKGEEGATLKDMTVMAADGNSFNYVGLTFDGITFDNSRLIFTGWRNGEEVIEDLTITNCTFNNLYDDTNSAPVHINKDAAEAVKNFTFTNNVINGATGGSKSGVYAQVTGKTVFTGNVINNVAFRPYVIQLTTDDGIADEFTVTGNTFSGSAAGRAQGLGNNAEGTDQVSLIVSNNIFKDITNAQQICYWNFNPETTTADLSKNYYDIEITANTNRIYYNKAASNVNDLVEMGIFPIYTELNADGTINTESAFTPEVTEDIINGIASVALRNIKGVTYEGEFFESGPMQDALYLNNWILKDDATIYVERTYGAVILENVKGNLNGDAIVVDNDNNSVMILENCDFTLAEGKKLIKSTNTIYQVFMANITINGEQLTQESAAKYLENVGWYQVVDPSLLH